MARAERLKSNCQICTQEKGAPKAGMRRHDHQQINALILSIPAHALLVLRPY